MIKNFLIYCFVLFFFSTNAQQSPRVSNYSFSTSDNVSFETGNFSTLLGPGSDDETSSVINIGFTFNFGGVNYNQFSVSSNGLFKFGNSVCANDYVIYLIPPVGDYLTPYFNDLVTASNGNVQYLTSGSSGSRKLVVEYNVTSYSGGNSFADIHVQIQLFENSNIIKFVYGQGLDSDFISLISADLYSDFICVDSNHNFSLTNSSQSFSNIWPGVGKAYVFQPLNQSPPTVSISSNATNNSICLGSSITFTANPSNAINPTYQWFKNGSAINGATNSTYNSSTLVNNDVIYVEMNVSGSGIIQSNSITTLVSITSTISTSIKLSTGSTLVSNSSSSSSWNIDSTLNDNNSLFQINSGHILSFINPINFVNGQNNTYSVSVISGCKTKNITVTISPYCGNWNEISSGSGDGLSQANAGESAYTIKRDYPNSTDGLYWISNANINNGTPFQIYADMTTDGGGWTLIMCNNQNSGWDVNTAILRNENSPTINGYYSIISYADYIKKSASGFQYMLDATTRGNWGGIWTANQAYSFVHTSNDQTNVTLDTTFGNWQYNNDGIEQIMPWFYPNGPGLITTSFDPGNNWWGTLITDNPGWTPAPWISNGNPNPGIIWYWVR